MNLHRTTGSPDWENVPAAERNSWQRLAAGTHSYITPANIITCVGLVLVLVGLFGIAKHHYWLGLILLIVGRLSDIADGWVAESTGTKSPLGEILDVTVDKIGTILTLIVFFVAHVTAWWLLVLLLLPHVVNIVSTALAVLRGGQPHASQLGKLSMAAAWFGVIGLLLVKALQLRHGTALAVVVYLVVFVSVVMGFMSALGYIVKHD